ncbi:MAG: retropepsin-like domain-containing protein [Saprospiraceae bacterium]|nr:retropepsin-like domain-containing protein [Saprospiraceae bacterium]
MFYRKLRLAILILFYCPWSMSGQIPKSYVFGESDQIVLPVTYINGFIIVDVIFQKILPLKFILDTGAENTILLKREYAEMLNIPFHKKIKLMGADMSEEVNAYICNGTFIQLTNTRSVRHNIIVLEKDYLFLEEYIGTQVDGILGAEFFKDLILKIDYKLSTLTIHDPEKFNYSRLKNYVNYDISIINNKPYLYCVTEPKAGTLINTLLLVDTGAGLTALFHHNTDTLLQLSGQIINGSLGKGLRRRYRRIHR